MRNNKDRFFADDAVRMVYSQWTITIELVDKELMIIDGF